MAIPPAVVDPGRAPVELDPLIDWFDRVARDLVLLEPYSLDAVRRAVTAVERTLGEHLGAAPSNRLAPEVRAIVRADHLRYRASLRELRGLLRIIERDDHGGHRQALGQYGRVLTESLRQHRALEKRSTGSAAAPPSRNSN